MVIFFLIFHSLLVDSSYFLSDMVKLEKKQLAKRFFSAAACPQIPLVCKYP